MNKFYNDVKSQGFQIGKDILYEYVDYFEDAFLAFNIQLYDQSLRKAKTQPKKLYAIDSGLARALTLNYENDLGRLFENIVFLDLKRLGCEINYLTSQRNEIDFLITTKRGYKKFFQVCWNADNTLTLAREEKALSDGIKELKIGGELITRFLPSQWSTPLKNK